MVRHHVLLLMSRHMQNAFHSSFSNEKNERETKCKDAAIFLGRKYDLHTHTLQWGEKEKSIELILWNVWKSGKMGVSKIYTII